MSTKFFFKQSISKKYMFYAVVKTINPIHFFQIAGTNCTIDTQECASTPCLYGGTCTEPAPNQYQCDCPPGIEGSNCQDVFTATFEGQGPLVVNYRSAEPGTDPEEIPRRKRQAVNGIQVALSFQTTLKYGILLFAQKVN